MISRMYVHSVTSPDNVRRSCTTWCPPALAAIQLDLRKASCFYFREAVSWQTFSEHPSVLNYMILSDYPKVVVLFRSHL